LRVVVQRVRQAKVSVDGETVAAIGPGVVVLVGVTHTDTDEAARWLAQKVAGLRIFEDAEGKMNAGLLDVGGQALVVSQFTLYADARRGRRPSFTDAAPPEVAEPLVRRFAEELAAAGVPVQTGIFGAHMLVEIHNDGPVTILLERM
jgi:D-tyrosyl-tRNA(Tyr) deacylase